MSIKIEQKIISMGVVTGEGEIIETVESSNIKKKKRPEVLQGSSYKVKDEGKDITVYVTINDKDGKPFELFLNSSHTESYEYIAVITRLVSAMFREGMCPEFIAKEFKKIWGAAGYFSNGKFRSSLISHIGDAILDHVKQKQSAPHQLQEPETQNSESEKIQETAKTRIPVKSHTGLTCPECKEPTLKKEGGCTKCLNQDCGYLGECG